MQNLVAVQGLLGIAALPLLAWALSDNRSALPLGRAARIVAAGLAVQVVLAVVLLGLPQSRILFEAAGAAVRALQEATLEGMRFAFGFLAGGPAPYAEQAPGNGFILAFRALPLILLMSVLSRVLYHWGILQVIVRGLSAVLSRALGISGPLGTAAAAKVFVGMVEAPLLIRPYLASLGRGELFALMSVGMATVAGTVFALYAAILEPVVPGAAGHVLAASLMNVPAALTLARLMSPEGFTEANSAAAPVRLDGVATSTSTMGAIADGTADGLKLLGHVVAMLVVMVALVALLNAGLGAAARPFGVDLTVQRVLGLLAAPFAILIGIPAAEAGTAGALIGTKVVLNELLAYIDMAKLGPAALSERSRTILTYALCGFGNFGSLGIMIGGLSAMVPERRAEIAELGLRSVLCGLLATLMTGAVVGVVLALRG